MALGLVLTACGDDDDDTASGTEATGAATTSGATGGAASDTTAGSSGATTPSSGGTAAGQPVQGGKAEVLVWNEVQSLDPLAFTSAAGSDGQRDFALYGALVGYDPSSGETKPIMAESITPNATFDTWTLKLRSGLVFTDDSPYDANAVKVNWERHQKPENASRARGQAASVSAMTVVDPQTLEIKLASPNAVFPATISRTALNYIASAKAIADGHDLANDPVGAGPFVLGEWIRDDHISLKRNPKWFDAPKPYLDELSFRVVTDEEQRINTFLKGDADAFWTTVSASSTRATKEEQGAQYVQAPVADGSALNFNTSKPPFDDVRVRKAIVEAIDWQAMIQVVDGQDALTATNLALEGSPWYSAQAAMPKYDPADAQKLIDAYLAEKGQSSLKFSIIGTQQNRNVVFVEYMQTALTQLKGLEVSVENVDSPTLTQRNVQGNYDLSLWGYPTAYPDPDLYQGIRSGLPTNMTRYANATVDQLLDQARQSGDSDARAGLYRQVYDQLAKDLPFRPTGHPPNGFVVAPKLQGMQLYQDGIIRSDLLWVST
jgi:peptide/nickel transport system substrate-binding protein